MERLPADMCTKIFCLLDHQNLATAVQVCSKWKVLASDNILWCNLFKERWGSDRATFFAPLDSSKPWKCVYEVQDRCDRVGIGLKIIREGGDYYLVHQGEIQRHLGSRQSPENSYSYLLESEFGEEEESLEKEPKTGILDRILFFIGDLETASSCAKRSRFE